MKKILIIITTGFNRTGGLTTVMLNYYRHINLDDLVIDFAATNVAEEDLVAELKEKGSTYYNLGSKKKNPVGYCINLFKLLLNNKYDVIHVNGNSSTMVLELMLAKICGIKERIAHGHASQSNYPLLHKILYPFFKKSYTTGIAVSKKNGDWLYGDNYILLNNAIDIDHYAFSQENREKVRSKYQLNDSFVIGNVGKLNAGKNHVLLLNVLAKIKEIDSSAKVMIAGGGPLEATLREKCKELNIEDSVIFLGMVGDTSEILSAFDVFVFPSLFEGLGMSLIEAQANGLQCISSSTVPFETRVTENVEYLDLTESVEYWASKIMTKKSENRGALDQSGIESINKCGYNIKHEAHKLKHIYTNE